MNMVLTALLFVLGLALIVRGGDWFVDAAGWIAEVSGIPRFLIGATVVSVATALPELFVSLLAAIQGAADMAAGNAVGSVTANLGLILAVSVLFAPAMISRRELGKKAVWMLAAAGLLLLFSLDGRLGLWESGLLLVVLVVHGVTSVWEARRGKTDTARPAVTRQALWVNVTKFIFGAGAMIVGADLLVDNGSALAGMLGVPEAVIAVTLLSVGTSLPELVTAVTAVVKKQAAMSVGNIIGANIIDLTLILPLCALANGGNLSISRQAALLDLPVCLALGMVALVPTLIRDRFSRVQGAALLAGYGVYVAALCLWFL